MVICLIIVSYIRIFKKILTIYFPSFSPLSQSPRRPPRFLQKLQRSTTALESSGGDSLSHVVGAQRSRFRLVRRLSLPAGSFRYTPALSQVPGKRAVPVPRSPVPTEPACPGGDSPDPTVWSFPGLGWLSLSHVRQQGSWSTGQTFPSVSPVGWRPRPGGFPGVPL